VADAPTAIKVGKYSMLVGFQTGTKYLIKGA